MHGKETEAPLVQGFNPSCTIYFDGKFQRATCLTPLSLGADCLQPSGTSAQQDVVTGEAAVGRSRPLQGGSEDRLHDLLFSDDTSLIMPSPANPRVPSSPRDKHVPLSSTPGRTLPPTRGKEASRGKAACLTESIRDLTPGSFLVPGTHTHTPLSSFQCHEEAAPSPC